MSKRENIKTTIEEIVTYWSEHEDESGLSVDFSEAHERCWRCGYKRKLERCHIVPASRGGEDKPSNFVLLCKKCHKENPNITDSKIMWDWLRAYAVPFYNTFRINMGIIEYEKIYGVTVQEECAKRKINDYEELRSIMKEKIKELSYHFGEGCFNSSTIAGWIRITLEEYDKRHNLKNDKNIEPLVSRKRVI